MRSTPCESEALDRLIARWAARIARSFGTIVEAIVTIAENVRDALHELKAYGRKARQLLAQHSGLWRPMMPKLESIGANRLILLDRTLFLAKFPCKSAAIPLQIPCKSAESGRR